MLVYSTCTISPTENERQIAAFLDANPGFSLDDLGAELPALRRPVADRPTVLTLPHRDRTAGFFIARLRRELRRWTREPQTPARLRPSSGRCCPHCGEPWLRPTNLPGRYRCVYCLHRFELASVCPNCGEHSTIVRMSSTAIVKCNNCGDSMLQAI